MNKYAVIMAGGSGTRLWPISRQNHPKHIIPFLGPQSFFQTTVERLRGVFQPENILIVTTREQSELLHHQAPWILHDNFILEPEPKGTAAVACLAASVIHSRDSEAIMALFPSDHHIANKDIFYKYLDLAFIVAEMDYLVTLGITPTHPETGYGYIQEGITIEGDFPFPVKRVARFKEKPDEFQAQEMLIGNDHSWNSGIFIWKTNRILQEFDKQMPDLKRLLEWMINSSDQIEIKDSFEMKWSILETQTIDYGIMENAPDVAVIPTINLGWNDIGSWDSLFDVLIPDNDQNISFNSNQLPIDTQSTLVYGCNKDKLVATIGVDDLIIVDSDDVLLVCKKNQSQHVKEVVKLLSVKNKKRYL